MFSLICVWINGVNNREAGDLRRYRAHYDVSVMESKKIAHLKSTLSHISSIILAIWKHSFLNANVVTTIDILLII